MKDFVNTRLDELSQLTDNWDNYDSLKPKDKAILNCRKFLWDGWYEKCPYLMEPLVSADSEGNITLEFFCESRKLTLYFLETTIEYIKIENENFIGDGIIDVLKDVLNSKCGWLMWWLCFGKEF